MVKMDMTAVADEHRARTDRIVRASRLLMPGIDDDGDACEALALALLELAEIWREEARKAMDENKRGCKGTADSLRDCATRVSGVAIAIRQHGLPENESDALGEPMFPAVQTPSGLVKGDSLPGDPGPKADAPVGAEPLSAGSDAFISPAVPLSVTDPAGQFLTDVGNAKAIELYEGVHEQTLAEAASNIIEQMIEKRTREAEVVRTDPDSRDWDMPLLTPELAAANAEVAGFAHNPDPRGVITVQWRDNINHHQVKVLKAAQIAEGVPPMSDNERCIPLPMPSITAADPAPAWALQPEVPVFELTDLPNAGPSPWLPVPEHASVSQVQLMGECGLKYWLRYRRGAPERPSWAMVGGSALHGCIEEIENQPQTWQAAIAHHEVPDLWRQHFEAHIIQTKVKNPLFPIETWHASKSGKEDRAWWDSDGPEMVHRYLEWRRAWVATGWEIVHDDKGPMVEHEFLLFTGGKPVKGFIDSVWYHRERNLLAIIDAKSGASAPPDYFQPAVYARALRQMRDVSATILGGYWDARKGELTAPGLVELEVRHPATEVSFRLGMLEAMNNAGIYMPNTNSAYGGCNSCSLKRSCPIGSRMNAGVTTVA